MHRVNNKIIAKQQQQKQAFSFNTINSFTHTYTQIHTAYSFLK